MNLQDLIKQAKAASYQVALLDDRKKNAILADMAEALRKNTTEILKANEKDIQNAENNNMGKALLDRLALNKERVEGMAAGLETLCQTPDPVGQVESMWTNYAGLQIGKMSVPLGLVCMIYEARPNVTADAAGLCLKSGNGVVLRGSSNAIHSNICIANILRDVLKQHDIDESAITFIEDERREAVDEVLGMSEYIDCAIPRGGAGLIQHVLNVAKVPVIETGVGNCHLYVEKTANLDKALAILINGKCQRPGVCNALETLLVDEDIAKDFLPKAIDALKKENVKIYGCAQTRAIDGDILEAGDEEFAKEFHDLEIAIRVVKDIQEAIEHIRTFSSHHSDAIVTENYSAAKMFTHQVDAACVYVNASTRYSDGGEFGFGAEIGISTQKMHVRGPMGVEALTSFKYIILGEGQVRE